MISSTMFNNGYNGYSKNTMEEAIASLKMMVVDVVFLEYERNKLGKVVKRSY